MTEIEKLNPGVRDLVAQARRPFNRGTAAWEKELPLLTFLHLTDPHRAETELKRLTAFAADMKGLYEDVLCTGDMVRKCYATGYEFWHECGCDGILTCIGNHDVLNNDHYDWTDLVPQAVQAATFIEPYVQFWGDVEYTPGTTYYCKRYPAQKVDLIVLNTLLDGEEAAEETRFLREKLARARQDDTGVVLALHDTSRVRQTVIRCRFSDRERTPSAPCGLGFKRADQEAVQAFIDGGGDFICCLAGHSHTDYLCYDPDFPRQLFLLGPAADPWKGIRHGDCDRVTGEKSQDAFNFVTFDRRDKLVKVIRVGADRDRLLRHRGVLVFRYTTGEILYED